jgi:UDP-glucose:(heptosyl)LPS alpha-1,3-glucosyltransferase
MPRGECAAAGNGPQRVSTPCRAVGIFAIVHAHVRFAAECPPVRRGRLRIASSSSLRVRRQRLLMRLAIIRQDYAPEGPTERFLESALEALLERNVAISLYTREIAPTRLQLIEQVICNPVHVGGWWRDAGFAHEVCRVIGKAKANLVEAHAPLPCCDVYRADDGVFSTRFALEHEAAARGRHWQLSASPHWHHLLAAERQMLANPWLAAVICPSPLVRDELRDGYGLPEERLPVIPLPVDVDALTPGLRAHRSTILERHGIDGSAVVFLWSGSDWLRDGAHAAIEALAGLPATTHLLLLGPPQVPAEAEALVRGLGAGSRITFAGQPPDREAYLGAADAFVLPAQYDPQPRTTFEALSCGLPVIVGARSGAASLVRDHAAGIALPARDGTALVDAMRSLLDAGARSRMGAQARQAVLPFAPAAMTLKLVLLYRDLLAATVANRRAGAPPTGASRP